MTVTYVSDPVHADVLAELRQLGEVHLGYGPTAVAYQQVRDVVEAVMLRSETFDRDKIADSPRLRIIARHGVGSDNVDLDAATDAGVWVTITPGRNARAVAEHVFALALALGRKIPVAAGRTRDGFWSQNKAELTGFELHGRALGLLGLGSIGSIVLQIARGFGMQVLVTDPVLDHAQVAALGARKVEFDELLAGSDVLSLHVPLVASTRHIIDGPALARLRPGAVLINTSRGGLVDEQAMVAALRSGRLRGAGLDVLEAESVDMKNPLPHNILPISELDNLIVTPHVAGQTEESLREVGRAATACIRQALAGAVPDHHLNTVHVPAA
ncbi:NAD(P)-dependent oxidoreductase [Pseudonocardia charpentierae]|uniref:NAD(P)-dependent oxidoreductase n=1 Tax=Pseudonocardia charpentierae TaxID=3075545 RepID=A0ABU2N865_9PSEU|nr:NAD(P)-dependent oxidoreductase [Pseudonocardia sp. DSM 45834]MDT0349678.1 NAD(P)-dependent oxidoreductase [Pseudonocardia sp. DSM 45834]